MKKKMVWLAGCLMAAAAVLTGCAEQEKETGAAVHGSLTH